MEKKDLIKIITNADKYDLVLCLTKQLILSGINSEQELISFLNSISGITQTVKVQIHNYYRNIKNGLYKLQDIPTITL
jgi:hypothetical protein